MYSPCIKRVVYTDRINFITFSFHFLQLIIHYCHIVFLEKILLLCPQFPVDLKASIINRRQSPAKSTVVPQLQLYCQLGDYDHNGSN